MISGEKRIEKDSLGKLEIPSNAYFGIYSLRSLNNFLLSDEKTNPQFIKAYLHVKLAAVTANVKAGLISKQKSELIINAIDDLLEETESAIDGKSISIYEKVIVDPYQGGAGTSLNMNINEVIANKVLELAGKNFGDYEFIHPIDDVNLSQSTNDTYITALKIASINLLRKLTESFVLLQGRLQEKEKEFGGIIKLGRTQLQDAVPVLLGQEFGAYAQAIARDRWRLYNAEERLRSVNLGGTAIGNSINANRKYVLSVNNELKKITALPIAKAEDLIDTTQNLDVFVEVHGLVKSGACSVIKICNDLRLLSSGPQGGIGEISLPPMQAGSSIMPGKVNPVIPESVIQICELVKGHDVVISNIASAGNLELNAFSPLLAHLFLKSMKMLRDSLTVLAEKCIVGIKANEKRCRENLVRSSAIATLLINEFGYDKIAELVKEATEKNEPFVEVIKKNSLLSQKEINELIVNSIGEGN
jgi:aspartate ammonia-lyase